MSIQDIEQGVAVMHRVMRYGFPMTLEYAIKNWALLAAAVIAAAVLLFVLYRIYQDSVLGRLHSAVSLLAGREREARSARKVVAQAVERGARLRARADSVRPRHCREASEALEDARALQKIAEDQILVAQNHVRELIVEEFPPAKQSVLCSKYLPESPQEPKPFTMGG